MTEHQIVYVILLTFLVLLFFVVRHYYKKYNSRVCLAVVNTNSIELVDYLSTKNIGIDHIYKGEKLTGDLTGQTLIIGNFGEVDIDESMFKKYLTIHYPEGNKIIDFNLSFKPLNVDIESDHSENYALVKWDLLKPGEFIFFKTLFSRTNYDFRRSYFSVAHRITDLNVVNNFSITYANITQPNNQKKIRNKLYKSMALLIFSTISFVFLLILTPYFQVFPKEINYTAMTKSDKKAVNVFPINDSLIVVKKGSAILDTLNIKETSSTIEFYPYIKGDDLGTVMYFQIVVTILGYFSLIFNMLPTFFRERAEYKVIRLIKKCTDETQYA